MQRITSLDYVNFFAEALGDPTAAHDLYGRAENATDPIAKVVLHQTARLVSLADWMDEAAPARPALKIFFFVALAEAVAKMTFRFKRNGESRSHVHLFFEDLCPLSDRTRLARAFQCPDTTPATPLTTSQAVDVLYSVRNDVVHRGQYFTVNLLEPDNTVTITDYGDGTLEVFLSIAELRGIVIHGAVAGAMRLLGSSP